MTETTKYGYLIALTSVLSWNTTATVVVEENEPERMSLATVVFCDCGLDRIVKLFVSIEMLSPMEKE